jgi:DNA polymerase-3 subunit delta
MTFEEIIKDLKNKIYKPFYLLTGEEPYYIDVITEYIAKNVLTEEEKSFNQTLIYGKDTNARDVINLCKRYNMMANNQVVILKEDQDLSNFDDLLPYFENPLNSTILVINYKYKKLDSRKKVYKTAEKNGITLNTKKIYDNQVPQWIEKMANELNINIEAKATILLTEFIGADLTKIRKELEKLKVSIEGKSNIITTKDIENNIGVSREFNIFELSKAFGKKDILTVNKIAIYYGNNSKQYHPILIIGLLFDLFFQKLFIYHLLKDKSQYNVAAKLGVSPAFVKDYEIAAKNYSPQKIVEIFSLLRQFDLKAKGVDANAIEPIDLYKELFFRILH